MNALLHKQLHEKLLIVAACTVPFSFKFNNVFIFLFALSWLLEGQWRYKWENIKTNRWIIFFVAYFLLYLIGLSYSANLSNGIKNLETKITLLLFPLILGTTVYKPDRKLLQKTLFWFTAACTVAAVTCLLFAVYKIINQIPPETSVYGGHDVTEAFQKNNQGVSPIWSYITYTELGKPLSIHPTYLSMNLVVCILFLLNIITAPKEFKRQRFISKGTIILLILFLTVFLILLSSRITVLLLFLFVFTFPIIRFYKRINKLMLVAGTFFVILIAGITAYNVPVIKHRFTNDLVLFSKDPKAVSSVQNTGMHSRMYIWLAAAEVVEEAPLTGVGTGDAQDRLNGIYTREKLLFLIDFNSHNQYLQTAAMLGLLAMLYLMLLFTIPAWRAVKTRNIVYLYFLFTVAVVCLTESIFQVNKGVVFYSLFNALFFFSENRSSNTPKKTLDT